MLEVWMGKDLNPYTPSLLQQIQLGLRVIAITKSVICSTLKLALASLGVVGP